MQAAPCQGTLQDVPDAARNLVFVTFVFLNSTFGMCNFSLTGCECYESTQEQPWNQVSSGCDNIDPPEGECVTGAGCFESVKRGHHRAQLPLSRPRQGKEKAFVV